MSDPNLRKNLIRLAAADPEIRAHVLPLLRTAKKYPTPKEVAKAAKGGADAIYKARSSSLADLRLMLQDAYEDATGTGVSFKSSEGDFGDRLKKAKEKLGKVDGDIMNLASMLEALSRDLKKVK